HVAPKPPSIPLVDDLSTVAAHGDHLFFLILRPPPNPTLFPYTTLFRSKHHHATAAQGLASAKSYPAHGTVGPVAHVSGPVQHERSEEHTPELNLRGHLECRLLLENIQRTVCAGGHQPRAVGGCYTPTLN